MEGDTAEDRLRALDAAATPAPWAAHEGYVVVIDDPDAPRGYPPHSHLDGREPDTALIVAMRNALPELLDVVRYARRESEFKGTHRYALAESLDALDAKLGGQR